MRVVPLVLLIVAVACGREPADPGPVGLDPVVLVRNTAGPRDVSITWFDQSGQVATTVVGTGQAACVRFLSTLPTDSVRFIVAMGSASSMDTLPGPAGTKYAKQWSPWFNPLTGLPTARADQFPFGAEYWSLAVPTEWALLMGAVDKAPC